MPETKGPFYNVMPEAHPQPKSNSKPTEASAEKKVFAPNAVNAADAGQVFNSAPATKVTMETGRKSIFKNLAFIVPAILIVLGAAGFIVWTLFLKGNDQVQSDTDVLTPAEQQSDPDITTPGDWLARYFGAETCTIKTQCGDSADPDRDGYTNKEEYDAGTDPNNPDSDSDGLADGDEHHIFGSDPLISRTYRGSDYNDSDFAKGGFDINTNIKYTDQQLLDIKAKIKERGLHQPTLTTIGTVALDLYDFKDPEASTLESLNIDTSPQAKLDRDTQRQSTIKKIGGALIKYKNEKRTFPAGNDFVRMSDEIAPYNTVATNYNDPIGKEQYVYGYEASASGGDFTLTYYSETQNQLIKYTAKNAEETAAKETAQVNNERRMMDLENIRNALMIYSTSNMSSTGTNPFVFPTQDQYPTVLIENRLLTSLPKDPDGSNYIYEVGPTFDTFSLKARFESPQSGTTGYICTQDECKNY